MNEKRLLDMKELVAIGGLLHDIGKPYQRSRPNPTEKDHSLFGSEFLVNLRSYLKIYAIFANYHHSKHLKELESNLETLWARFSEEFKSRFKGVSYHELFKLLKIVEKADNLSSSEREEGEFTCKFWNVRMIPPFLKIGKDSKGTYKYEVEVLDFDKPNYPKPEEELEPDIRHRYDTLMRELREQLDTFPETVYPYNVNLIALLLERYLSFVPSYTLSTDGKTSTHISLYDHLRSTSAIAVCLLDYLVDRDGEEFEVNIDPQEKPFLLLMIDISGIQKFIYNIGTSMALKNLRARSLYLNLVLEDIVNEILSRLNYPRVNALYVGGGRGLLMLANTPQVKTVLKELYKEIQRWAVEEWSAEIAVLLSWLEVSIRDLEMQFSGKVRELNLKLLEERFHKFKDVPEKLLQSISKLWKEDVFTCDVCSGKFPISAKRIYKVRDEEREVCPKCELFTDLGQRLHNLQGIALTRPSQGEFLSGPFSSFIWIDSETRLTSLLKRGDLKLSLVKPSFIERITSLGVPFSLLLLSEKVAISDDKVKEFSELARDARGVDRIGVLRMDVDNLGYLFGNLKRPSEYSTISRLLSLFFQRYIDHILKLEEGEVMLEGFVDKDYLENVTVIYSGGDDLFIVGAWNEVLEAGFRIYKKFKDYVANAPDITISGGYGIFDEKYPIYKLALEIGYRLDELAKEEAGGEKNRIALVEFRYTSDAQKTFLWKSCRWNDFVGYWQSYGVFLLRAVNRGCNGGTRGSRLSRAVIIKLLELWQQYLEEHSSVEHMKLRWITTLAYLLARARCGDSNLASYKLFRELLKVEPSELKVGHRFFKLGAVLKFVELLTREKRREER